MPSTTLYKRGDVVLVPFPFTDLRTVKQRPALVVSSANQTPVATIYYWPQSLRKFQPRWRQMNF